MVVKLNEQLVHQLEGIAAKKQRDVNELVEEVLEQFVNHETDRDAFRAKVRRHMQEHAWLLKEFAKGSEPDNIVLYK